MASSARVRSSPAYSCVEQLLARDACVMLDGGIATELGELEVAAADHQDEALWGPWALLNSPQSVTRVHRAYAELGCNVISTNTWGIQESPPADWLELARRGVRLARQATAEVGRANDCAVAFSLHGDVDGAQGRERLELLTRAFEDEPPDLLLLETMSLIRDETFDAVETVLASGLPVWLSFRRCRHGLCGVFGQHWGGPEGDLFGRAARRFEEMGVSALLINCIPPDHVDGMLPWLRDFTDMPLGVYPNLGYYTESGWASDDRIGAAEYADLAAAWREEGAQILGGCCGVRPHHIAAARARLADSRRGSRRPESRTDSGADVALAPSGSWEDEHGRSLYPLPMPRIMVEPGVFAPTPGSFLAWKHLFTTRVGEGRRCLDVGCGTGLLTVQLALNGAAHVHSIDIDERAVANTLSNAFRNGLAERVSGERVDLYPWEPDERYEVVVASLYQMPNDPFEQLSSHRPLDYWGRSLLDHLIGLLPSLLTDDGRAYVMQLSVLSQAETLSRLERQGLRSRVVDFACFEFSDLFHDYEEQIARVEELSDAYHLTFGESDTMVAYLLEIERA